MKYLITQEQVTRLQELADAFELVSIQGLIDELKPLEPLTFDELTSIYKASPATQTSTPSMNVLLFARAIEACILGEKT